MKKTLRFPSFSVGKKLAAGFGFLVILAAIMAGFGVHTLSQFNSHSNMVELATEAETSLLAARSEEKNFRIHKDEVHADAAITLANQAAEYIGKLKKNLVNSQEIELAGQILAGIAQYNILMEDFRPRVNDRVMVVDAIERRLSAEAKVVVNNATELQKIQSQQMTLQYQLGVRLLLSILGALITLAVIVSWRLARSITKPIKTTIESANKMAAGDLSVDVENHRTDEFGTLMSTFGETAGKLRELVQRIDSSADNINNSSQTLSTITQRSIEGVHQQNEETEQVASAINEMVTTVTQVSRSATSASEAARIAHQKSDYGNECVLQTVDAVTNLNQTLGDSRDQLGKLQTDANNIVAVLDVIRSVAQQTNLLALNAAIEASRAGDQGRGFAVVADEVRSLAQRTQSSASEIEILISTLLASVEGAMKAMNAGTQLGEDTLQQAGRTGHAIQETVSAVEDILQINTQIATAAEQQMAVAEEVNRNVIRIRDIGQQSSASTEQVADASDELATFADQLKTQVSRFRL